MPDAAEVLPLVLELLHLDHLREPLDPLHERVLDRCPHPPRERHELGRRKRLVAEEDHQVVEERAPDLGDGLVGKRPSEVDAEDLGAERAGDAPDFDGAVAAHGAGRV